MRRETVAWLLAAILVAGFLVRALYLAELMGDPRYDHPVSDEAFHDYWARASLSGDWSSPEYPFAEDFRTFPHIKAPGYTLLLTAIYRVTGGSYLAVRLLQMIVGLVSVWLAYLLGRKILDPPTGLIFAACMSVYWGFVYLEGLLHAPAWTIAILFVLFLLLLDWPDRFSWPRGLVIGLCFGWLILLRENLSAVLPAALLWAGIGARRKRREARLAGPLAAALAGTVLVIAPVTVENARRCGEFIPVSARAGRNLYLGNNPSADGIRAIIPGLSDLTGSDGWTLMKYPAIKRGMERIVGRAYTHKELDKYFARRAARFSVDHTRRVVKLTVKKALLFWGPGEVSGDRVVHFDRFFSPVLRRLPGTFSLSLALGVIGAALLWVERNSRRPPVAALTLMALFGLVYFLSFLPGLPASRYRMILLPGLLLLGAYAIRRIFALGLRGYYAQSLTWFGAAAALYLVLAQSPVRYHPNAARWYFERAVAYRSAGDTERALKDYAAALQADPGFTDAHNSLAVWLAREGHLDRARIHLEALLRKAPRYARGWNNLGTVLARLGHFEEAVAAYRQAVAIIPRYREAHANLAETLRALGRPEEAEKHEKAAR